MNVKVIMTDDYRFIASLDNEAVELLHQIGRKRNVSAERIVNEIMLGGLVMQNHLYLHPESAGIGIKRNRWIILLNLLKKLRR